MGGDAMTQQRHGNRIPADTAGPRCRWNTGLSFDARAFLRIFTPDVRDRRFNVDEAPLWVDRSRRDVLHAAGGRGGARHAGRYPAAYRQRVPVESCDGVVDRLYQYFSVRTHRAVRGGALSALRP